MITFDTVKAAASRRIWYLVEGTTRRDIGSTYAIMSEYSIQNDLLPSQRVINQEPLTMAEAKAFKKLLTGVQS
jgi:hypothetical protein